MQHEAVSFHVEVGLLLLVLLGRVLAAPRPVQPWPTAAAPTLLTQSWDASCSAAGRVLCDSVYLPLRPESEDQVQRWDLGACRPARWWRVELWCEDVPNTLQTLLLPYSLYSACDLTLAAAPQPDNPCLQLQVRAWTPASPTPCAWWVQQLHSARVEAEARLVTSEGGLVLSETLTRLHQDDVLQWIWWPAQLANHTPQLRLSPPEECLRPAQFVVTWSVVEQPLMACAWCALLTVYQWGWMSAAWIRYRRLAVTAHSALLGLHVPLLRLLSFSDYCLASAASMGLMCGAVLLLWLRRTRCTDPKDFRLLRRDQRDSLVSLFLFVCLHSCVLGTAWVLGR